MIRGTTPTLTFVLPYAVDIFSAIGIAFMQNGKVDMDKSLKDCTVKDNKLTLKLSQAETLKFSANPEDEIEIQLRLLGLDSSAYASQVIHTSAKRILKEGELTL